jgi:dihydroorotase-like cyclic amidohydrolase
VLGRAEVRLAVGGPACLSVFRPERWTYEQKTAQTRGFNSPWEGRELGLRGLGVVNGHRACLRTGVLEA